jgi:ABC-type antimicrobial peptide transport system permease subunit
MAVWLRLRSELRSRLPSWLGLALLVGLAGGLVIGAAAGARRTETAVPRSAAASKFSDVSVSQFGHSTLDFSRIRRLPPVDYAYRSDNFFFTGRTDSGRRLNVGKSGLYASADPSVGNSRDAPKILRGRRADPRRVDEAVADEDAARMLGLKVGSRFMVNFAAADQLEDFLSDTGGPSGFPVRGPRATFKIVGISAVFSTPSTNYSETQLTSAFYRAQARKLARGPAFGVYLGRGEADLPSFKKEVEQIAGKQRVEFRTKGQFLSQVQRSVHIQAAALWVLAGLAGLFALLVVGQALARQTVLESREYPTLRALGMTSGQLLRLALARTAAIAVVGALLAGGLAVALSPAAPVGSLARKAEPHPGLSVDVMVVVGGAVATILLVAVLGAVPAFRAVRQLGGSSQGRLARSGRASPVAARLARAGFPPTAVSGVRMALEPGQGRTAVPVRTTIAGSVIAIAAIAAALTFGASFDRLANTPRLYGQNWDAQFGDGFNPDISRLVYPVLRRDRFIGAFSGGTINEASIGGERVSILAMEQVQGSIGPTLTDGRAPTAPDEVVLSPKTLDTIGASVGDVVTMSVGKSSARARIVGEGVLADIAGANPLLGQGGMLTLDGYRRLVPNAPRNYFLVRFAAGVDRNRALASLRGADALTGGKPVDVANYSRIDSMPIVIGGLLGLIAVASLMHTLMTSLRRRRRDLAILKMLGFERGQISRIVAWQATTIVAIALLIGVPLGIAAGRWGWRLFAEELGVVPDAVVPFAPTLLLIPAALLVANLIAVLPARVAANTRPALVLKAE